MTVKSASLASIPHITRQGSTLGYKYYEYKRQYEITGSKKYRVLYLAFAGSNNKARKWIVFEPLGTLGAFTTKRLACLWLWDNA
jgi:hypothetical protein